MRTWQTHFLTVIPVLAACLAWMGSGVCVMAAEESPAASAGHDKTDAMADIKEDILQLPGVVPEGDESHAVDYHRPPLLPEIPLFVFSLVLFAGFVLLMRTSVWSPLISGLDAREARIVNAEAEARAARLEAEQLAAKAEKRMAEVHNEVKAIVTKARVDAEATRLEIVTQAETEAQRVKQEALAAISQARIAALAELDHVVEQQVSLAVQSVSGRQL